MGDLSAALLRTRCCSLSLSVLYRVVHEILCRNANCHFDRREKSFPEPACCSAPEWLGRLAENLVSNGFNRHLERLEILSRRQTKDLLKELDRLGHVFVLDILNYFFESLDESGRVGFDIAPRWNSAHVAEL
jgi:hypothetical protein